MILEKIDREKLREYFQWDMRDFQKNSAVFHCRFRNIGDARFFCGGGAPPANKIDKYYLSLYSILSALLSR
jgi:hypothetical protein